MGLHVAFLGEHAMADGADGLAAVHRHVAAIGGGGVELLSAGAARFSRVPGAS